MERNGMATFTEIYMVASVESANVFVCKMEAGRSVILNETDVYANQPIDEILSTELFNTLPFNAKITDLLEQRKKMAENGDHEARKSIEGQLRQLNPQYFGVFDLLDDYIKGV